MNKYSKSKWINSLILILALSASSVAYSSQDVAAEEKLAKEKFAEDRRKDKWAELARLDGRRVKTLEEEIEDCITTVRELNAASETLDRMDDNASEKIQLLFTNYLSKANECTAELTKWTGNQYTVSKDWFGSGYTLKKP